MSEKMSDTEAMNQIFLLMDGEEWDSDTTTSIADIVAKTGREISEQGNLSRDELEDLLTQDWIRSVQDNQEWVPSFLAEGFKGFDHMSYAELLKDARDNGLTEE